MKIEIKEVVCDWGIYIDNKLNSELIFNSLANAKEVKRIMELDDKNKKHDSGKQKIKITKSEAYMLNMMKAAKGIDVGIVDYKITVPQVLISNETNLIDAWLHPELIEVVG